MVLLHAGWRAYVLCGMPWFDVCAGSKVLGHINGNAIYNNSDPAFVQFVDFTLARWDYSYSYDVALWATIADFPYSWPLWQRFSSKFVTTNLVSQPPRPAVCRLRVLSSESGLGGPAIE